MALSLEHLTTDLEKTSFASNQRISCFTIGYGSKCGFNLQTLNQMAQTTGGYHFKGDPEAIRK